MNEKWINVEVAIPAKVMAVKWKYNDETEGNYIPPYPPRFHGF